MANFELFVAFVSQPAFIFSPSTWSHFPNKRDSGIRSCNSLYKITFLFRSSKYLLSFFFSFCHFGLKSIYKEGLDGKLYNEKKNFFNYKTEKKKKRTTTSYVRVLSACKNHSHTCSECT